MNSQTTSSQHSPQAGFFFALSAYGLWGFLPLFFRATDHIPPMETVAHRIIWSVPIALVVMLVMGRINEVMPLLRNWKILRMMVLTAFIISINWGIYIWSISVDRTSEAALGYYINPLITVLLGFALLGEKLNNGQKVAILLATLAVLIRAVMGGIFPWIALSLAVSFAIYGYLRKTVPVGPTQGFLLEVIVLAPFALAYVIWLMMQGEGHLNLDGGNLFWLMSCGFVTAVPLLLYAFAAKALTLTSLGLMQYIAPTLIFCVAVFIFDEPLDVWQASAFAMIWTALAIYTWSTFRRPKPI